MKTFFSFCLMLFAVLAFSQNPPIPASINPTVDPLFQVAHAGNDLQFRSLVLVNDSGYCDNIYNGKISHTKSFYQRDENGHLLSLVSYVIVDGDTVNGYKTVNPVLDGPWIEIDNFIRWDTLIDDFNTKSRTRKFRVNDKSIWSVREVLNPDNGEWLAVEKYQTEFNRKGLIGRVTSLVLNDTTGLLENVYRWDYTFSEKDETEQSRKIYEWQHSKNRWKEKWRITTDSCEMGSRCVTNQYNYDDSGWANTTRSMRRKNPDFSETISQKWSKMNSVWENDERIFSTSSSDTSFNTTYHWNNQLMEWIPSSRRVTISNALHRKYYAQEWVANGNKWKDVYRDLHLHYPDAIGDTTIRMELIDDTNQWDTTYFSISFLNSEGIADSTHTVAHGNFVGTSGETNCRYYYSYVEFTPVTPPAIDSFSCFFANPYNVSSNIRCLIPEGTSEEYTVELFDMNGRRITSHVMPENGLFSFRENELASGIYVLRVLNKNKSVLTKKICILPGN